MQQFYLYFFLFNSNVEYTISVFIDGLEKTAFC
jgi:hypothetical protein